MIDAVLSPLVSKTVWALLFAGAIARALVLPLPGTPDVQTQKLWSFGAAYDLSGVYGVGGIPPERRFIKWQGIAGAVDYPPLALWELGAVGRLYRTVDVNYGNTATLNAFIKIPAILSELAFVVIMLRWGRKWAGSAGATWAAMAFWLTPAVWYVGEAVGYVDAQGAVPAAFSVVAAVTNHPLLAGALLAIGALTKPQCVYLLPVVAAIVIAKNRSRIVRALAAASAGGVGVTAIVMAPFVLRGSVPNVIQGVGRLLRHDMLSAQAANIGWIVTWILRVKYAVAEMGWHTVLALKIRILTMERIMELGYVNPRWIAMPVVFGAIGWAAWRSLRVSTVAVACALAGWAVYAYVILGTAVHENHFYPAIPLFAIAAATIRSLRPIFWATTTLFALNIYLFYGLGDGRQPVIDRGWTYIDLTVLLAVVNIALFIWCTILIVRLTRTPEPAEAA
jgi:hypothetical protein